MMRHCAADHRGKHALSSVFLYAGCAVCLLVMTGCASLVSSAASDMMGNLSKSILNSDDLDTVHDGAPAYLLMIDSLIRQDPDNKPMLMAAAQLYSAYSDVFVKDKERSGKMSAKALEYARQALCLARTDACGLEKKPFETFEKIVFTMEKETVPELFTLGNAWAGWILANKSDFNAIADMASIETIMKQVVRLDETYKDGAAYLYLGTLSTLLPPALGGNPEQGRFYFEKALSLSRDKNLMAKVLFAKMYARMIFDRPLHDRLLKEVLEADPYVPDHTLINTFAQNQAMELMRSADDFF